MVLWTLNIGLLLAAILLYCVSLFLPCFGSDGNLGIVLLVVGVFGIFGYEFAWFANPFFLVVLLLNLHSLKHTTTVLDRVAILLGRVFLSFVPICFMLSFLFQESTHIGGPGPVGTNFPTTPIRAGYWCWLTSGVVLFVQCIVNWTIQWQEIRKKPGSGEPSQQSK
jgi:hypothetical protein